MSADARREARRKKILDNSQTRLRKIANIQRKDDSEEEIDKDSLGGFALKRDRALIPSKSDKKLTHTHNESSNSVTEIHTLFENSNDILAHVSSGHLVANKKFRRSIIILLAVFVRFCNYINMIYANKIFIPFLTLEVIDLALVKSDEEQSSWLNTLLLFSNIQPRALGRVMFCTNVFVRVLHDMFVYFFTFIMCDLCIKMIQ